MLDFISVLETDFEKNSNLELAIKQEAYMRNQFTTFGIKTENRRRIQKPFLVKAYLPKQENLENSFKFNDYLDNRPAIIADIKELITLYDQRK